MRLIDLDPLRRRPRRRLVALAAAAALVSGCAIGPGDRVAELGVADPYESFNRKVHVFNQSVDRQAIEPASAAFAAATPGPARTLVRNLLDHLEYPRDLANHLASGRFAAAGRQTARVALNTVLGAGGLLDPAAEWGLVKEDADFGQTLFGYGVGEGVYYEAPFLGPTIARHTVGRSVDFVLNPTMLVSLLDFRDANRFYFDEIYNQSADSYASLRSTYIQNRRFYLTGEAGGGSPDPFEELDDPTE